MAQKNINFSRYIFHYEDTSESPNNNVYSWFFLIYTYLQEMLLPTINPFYMQSTIWKVIIPNQNKKQCSAAFKSALHQVNDNQKKLGKYKTYITCVTQMFRQFKVQIMVLFSLARHLLP